MSNIEIQEKVNVLMNNEMFREKVSSCKSYEEIAQLFCGEGLEVNAREFETGMAQMSSDPSNGELSEEELENVAGGIFITGTSFLIGCICYSLAEIQLAYVVGKYSNKNSKKKVRK